jgi:hypothetical protein
MLRSVKNKYITKLFLKYLSFYILFILYFFFFKYLNKRIITDLLKLKSLISFYYIELIKKSLI